MIRAGARSWRWMNQSGCGGKEDHMIEIGVFHNGASDLPAITTPQDVVVNDGSLDEVHHSYQRVLVSQVRQGILAEHLGFDYWFMTG